MAPQRSRPLSQDNFTLENVCRLCLFSNFSMRNIFRTHIASGDEVYKVLNDLFGLEITVNDSLPPNICQSCFCKVTAYFAFKGNILFAKSQLIEIVDELRTGVPREETEYVAVDSREAIIQEKQLASDVEESNVGKHNEFESSRLVEYVEGEVEDEAIGFSAVDTKLAMKEEVEIVEWNTSRDLITVNDSIHENESELMEGQSFWSTENDQPKEVILKVERNSVDEVDSMEQLLACPPAEGVSKESGSHRKQVSPRKSHRRNLKNNQETSSAPSNTCSNSPVSLDKLRSNPQKRKREQDEEGVVSLTKSVNKENWHHSVNRGSGQSDPRILQKVVDVLAEGKVIVEFEGEQPKDGINREKGEFMECYHCGEKKSTLDELKDHIYTRHSSLFSEEENGEGNGQKKMKKYSFCHKSYKYKSLLARHSVKHTKKKAFNCISCNSRTSDGFPCKSNSCICTGKKLFICEVCNYSTKISTNFNVHLRRHAGEKPFKCDLCEYRSSTMSALKVHLQRHTGEKPFKCGLCEYRACIKSDLNAHLRGHTGEKPFKCDLCEYRGSTKSDVRVHLRGHTGEKPFKCNLCEFRTSFSSALSVHLHRHTGEKPFKCGMCEYRACIKSALKVHLRTHTGEKPFKCNLCEFRTSSSSSLRKHLQRHTGKKPFKCGMCEYRAYTNSALKVHLHTHKGKKPFKCDV